MRKKIQEKMFEFCYILELAISCIIGIAVIILSIKLCLEMVHSTLFGSGDEILVSIFDNAMTLAIGVEFIKMLCTHTPETVIEVLLFAIARQLIVVHTTPLENLITIISIAVLFAIRKFLLRKEDPISFSIFRKKNVTQEKTEDSSTPTL